MMVLVIGHRGASVEAPENTMASFQAASDGGADGSELDCQMTKDGHLVVLHDPTLERTTDGTGWVHERTLAEIKALDAGRKFDERFAGESVPALTDVLQFVRGKCFVNIEIKNLPIRHPSIEEELLRVVRSTGFPLDALVVSSFDHHCLQKFSLLEPNLQTASLFAHDPVAPLEAYPGKIVHPHWSVVDETFMQRARNVGRSVNVWTVNDPRIWTRMINLGVNGIMTDDPMHLRQWLRQNTGIDRSEV